MVSLAGATTISSTTSASAYAAKFGSGSATTVNGELTLAGGGMILNGGTLSGDGAVNFAGNGTPVTGMVFAGSTTASAIGGRADDHAGAGEVRPRHVSAFRHE